MEYAVAASSYVVLFVWTSLVDRRLNQFTVRLQTGTRERSPGMRPDIEKCRPCLENRAGLVLIRPAVPFPIVSQRFARKFEASLRAHIGTEQSQIAKTRWFKIRWLVRDRHMTSQLELSSGDYAGKILRPQTFF